MFMILFYLCNDFFLRVFRNETPIEHLPVVKLEYYQFWHAAAAFA